MKPDTYDVVDHCKDCEFCWALGACRCVCTIGVIDKLPLHPHDAINLEDNESLFIYDKAVRLATTDADVVDPHHGTCSCIVIR